MKYSQPGHLAGLSPCQDIVQFSVFGTGLRFWHKTFLSGSTSLCELWSVTGTCSWVFLLPEDALIWNCEPDFALIPVQLQGSHACLQSWESRHACLHLPHCWLTGLQAGNIKTSERLLFPLPCYWLQGWAVQRHWGRAGNLLEQTAQKSCTGQGVYQEEEGHVPQTWSVKTHVTDVLCPQRLWPQKYCHQKYF